MRVETEEQELDRGRLAARSDQRYFLPGFCVKLHQQLVQQGSYRATTAGCGRIINKPFPFYSFDVKAWFVAL